MSGDEGGRLLNSVNIKKKMVGRGCVKLFGAVLSCLSDKTVILNIVVAIF